MTLLHLPLELVCAKFRVSGFTRDQVATALVRVSEGFDKGVLELDIANKNQLQIFCADVQLYEWLAEEGFIGCAVLGYIYRCDGNMLHGPDCDCTLLPPSKRQGQGAKGAKA